MGLSPKERRFVSEFVKDQNAKQAAIRAGYSPKTSETQGPRLYRKVQVRAACDAAQTKISAKNDLTAERIEAALLAIAEADIRKAFNADGTLKPIHEIPDDVAVAISSIEIDENNADVKRVRFLDKVRPLELLGKRLQMFKEIYEHTGKGGRPLIPGAPRIDLTQFSMDQLKAFIVRNGNGANPLKTH